MSGVVHQLTNIIRAALDVFNDRFWSLQKYQASLKFRVKSDLSINTDGRKSINLQIPTEQCWLYSSYALKFE